MKRIVDIIPVASSAVIVLLGGVCTNKCLLFLAMIAYAVVLWLVSRHSIRLCERIVKPEEIAVKIKVLVRVFLKTWWSIMLATGVVTVPLPLVMNSSLFECLGACSMAVVLLFGQFVSLQTKTVFTNVATFRQGSIGYSVVNFVEFVLFVFISLVPLLRMCGFI